MAKSIPRRAQGWREMGKNTSLPSGSRRGVDDMAQTEQPLMSVRYPKPCWATSIGSEVTRGFIGCLDDLILETHEWSPES